MRIRVLTRANLFAKRKQEHVERGFRIEEENSIPINGFCSFIAVKREPDSLRQIIAQAFHGKYSSENELDELTRRRTR